MATVIQQIRLKDFDVFDGVAAPTVHRETNQTGQADNISGSPTRGFPWFSLGFPHNQLTAAYFLFSVGPANTTSGNGFTFVIDWCAQNNVAANAVFGVQMAVMIPATAFGYTRNRLTNPKTVTAAVTTSQANGGARASIVINADDAGFSGILSPNCAYILKVFRDATDTTTDTLRGAARITNIYVSYPDV